MKKADRWTVHQAKKPGRSGKRWVVYPPGFLIGGHVHLHRRFSTWDEAIDEVFKQMGAKRQQSLRTRSLGLYHLYTTPDIAAGTPVRFRVNGVDVGVEPWHGRATGQAS